MSGAMRRIGEYLGLLEDTGHYDEYDGQYDPRYDAPQGQDHQTQETAPVQATRVQRRQEMGQDVRTEPRTAAISDISERRRQAPSVASVPPAEQVGTVAELSRIITLHPRTYNEARIVGENFREGTPVIMNLSEMDDNDAKRLVDFAAGLVFATRGTIERITNKVFLLSPPNVSVAAEDKQRIVEGGFFNQS